MNDGRAISGCEHCVGSRETVARDATGGQVGCAWCKRVVRVPAPAAKRPLVLRLFVFVVLPMVLLAVGFKVVQLGLTVEGVLVGALALLFSVVSVCWVLTRRLTPDRVPLLVAITRFFGFLG